jgi:hypothetical protein
MVRVFSFQLPAAKLPGHCVARPRPRQALAQCGQRERLPAVAVAKAGSPKNDPQALRSAEAPFRHGRSDHPEAQLIPVRLAKHPSRSRHRELIAGGSFFRASGRGARD